MNRVVEYILPATGLVVALLAVLTEMQEFNDFPAQTSVALAYVLALFLTGYHIYKLDWKPAFAFVFVLFFQTTAIRAADYQSFTQAHLLSILFIGLTIYNQKIYTNRLLLIPYGFSLLLSLIVVLST